MRMFGPACVWLRSLGWLVLVLVGATPATPRGLDRVHTSNVASCVACGWLGVSRDVHT